MIYFKKNGQILRYKYDLNDKIAPSEIKTSLVPYLIDSIKFEDGLTFETFMKHIFDYTDEYNIVFSSNLGHYYLGDWKEEFEKEIPVNNSDMDYLEVRWSGIEIPITGRKLSEFEKELDLYTEFHGWGKWENGPGEYGGIGIEYCPLNDLKQFVIKLNTDVTIYDTVNYLEFCKMDKYLSVYDVIGAILYEISWAGNPKSRDEQKNEVFSRIDEVQKEVDEGKIKLKSGTAEEFLNDMNIDDDRIIDLSKN